MSIIRIIAEPSPVEPEVISLSSLAPVDRAGPFIRYVFAEPAPLTGEALRRRLKEARADTVAFQARYGHVCDCAFIIAAIDAQLWPTPRIV